MTMNWKQTSAGLGAVAVGAILGGMISGKRGFEAGALIAGIGGLAISGISQNYGTAGIIATTAGLGTATAAWGFTGGGKKHFRGAMESARALSRV